MIYSLFLLSEPYWLSQSPRSSQHTPIRLGLSPISLVLQSFNT
jgi:hypothetical protein